ncbi:MAG: hypothetical protein IT328_06595 [Caldilineaceae bacterium]|nr:hypothetical protein [Caldilineaceae bacterium]
MPKLPTPYAEALRDAVDFILARYEVWGVLVAGTIIAGTPDANSDLDMFVIHAKPQRQRVQKRFQGVATEIFVNPPATIRRYFAEEVTRPSTAHMLANGVVLLDRHPVVEELIAEARSWLATPPNLSETHLTMRRYSAADAFENAQDIALHDPANSSLILHQAVQGMIEYTFLAANRPLPRAKQMLAALAEFDPTLGDLARRYYDAETHSTRLVIANQIAARTIQATGFFEWETPVEEMPR